MVKNLEILTQICSIRIHISLLTPTEMQKFMGICILMGNLNYPRLRMYWQTSYHVPGIADVMTQKRFLKIFANLAARSYQEWPRESTNICWKVAPIIDAVRNACISLPPEESEQHRCTDDSLPRSCSRTAVR